jgi:hypothetical protein
VNGKVDVWSSEGMGTEIRVTFDVEAIDDDDDTSSSSSVASLSSAFGQGYSISLQNFAQDVRGSVLSAQVLSSYARGWHFGVEADGDIVIINDDESALRAADTKNPIIFLLSVRTFDAAGVRDRIIQAGGCCQLLYKPIGPSGFSRALRTAIDWIEDRGSRPPISRGSSGASMESNSTISEMTHFSARTPLTRRRSEEDRDVPSRPNMAPRGMTYHAPRRVVSISEDDGSVPASPESTASTISLAGGGVMLKAATIEPAQKGRTPRVMVVEDNVINRRVLSAFLRKKVCAVRVSC